MKSTYFHSNNIKIIVNIDIKYDIKYVIIKNKIWYVFNTSLKSHSRQNKYSQSCPQDSAENWAFALLKLLNYDRILN